MLFSLRMKILAIETSCDETAIAILEINGSRQDPNFRVLSHIVSSQVKLHAKFGGVVPNLARREHEHNLVPITVAALKQAKLGSRIQNTPFRHSRESGNPESISAGFPIKSGMIEAQKRKLHSILNREPELLAHVKKSILPLAIPDIDVTAVTYGPGLAPALWVGVNFARALSYLWNKPLIPVNHMAGHFYSALIDIRKRKRATYKKISFPALALLVSGAHTELVLVKKHGDFKIIGSTRDDAAGEAFDKVGRMLGFGYPGGPAISAAAEHDLRVYRHSRPASRCGINSSGNPESISAGFPIKSGMTMRGNRVLSHNQIKFPRPMINSKNYDFSFSGLKTAVLYLIRDELKRHRLAAMRPAIAREFQNAVIDVLVAKTVRAAKEFKVKTVTLGGGVSANATLRVRLAEKLAEELPRAKFIIPELALTGDNALMIALAAYFCGKKMSPDKVRVDANTILGTINTAS